jgi:hypothetical protein
MAHRVRKAMRAKEILKKLKDSITELEELIGRE